MKQATFEWILRQYALPRGARILDLGCATGFLIALAINHGFEAYGLDVNPFAIESCRVNVPGASVHCGTLADKPFSGVHFDAVYMVDVLEHVRNPRAELRLVSERLNRGGVVVISTPSLDSFSRKVLGWRWLQYREEHLTYFTRVGLTRLLRDAGFDLVNISSTRKTMTLNYVYRHLQKYRHPVLTPFSKILWRLMPYIRSVKLPVRLGEMTVVARVA